MTLIWHGKQVTAEVEAAAVHGLLEAAEVLLDESRQVVPFEEGTLSRSGRASVDAGKLAAGVSYDTPYAVRQHEELDYRHDPGRTAKYLERPLKERQKELQQHIADRIRRAMRG